jgi:glycosyltransferase involved in cell wall biosynthesis
MTADRPRLDVVLPVHEEAAIIERVLDESYGEFCRHVVPRFIVCEGGSRDGTRQVIEALRARLPIMLRAQPDRGSYSAAVIEGIATAETEHVLVMDADGQCDPRDLPRFLAAAAGADIVVGQRVPRRDPAVRRFLSFGFRALHRFLFGATVRDPSCPYVLLRRAAVAPLLPTMGRLPTGFWWELAALAKSAGCTVHEVPTRHRERWAGRSRAIRLSDLPRLALTHVVGLVRLRLGTLRRPH